MKNYYQLKLSTDGGETVSLTVQNAKRLTPALFYNAIEMILDCGAIKTASGIVTKFTSANFCTQTITPFDVKAAE